MSRHPSSPLLNSIFISQVSLQDDIRKVAEIDLYMKKKFQRAANDPTNNYVVKNGLCFYNKRVVVPLALNDQLLKEFHDNKVAGYSRVLRTFKRLAVLLAFYAQTCPRLQSTLYNLLKNKV